MYQYNKLSKQIPCLQIGNDRKSYVVCILLENFIHFYLRGQKFIGGLGHNRHSTKDVINVHQTMTDVTLK